MDKNECDYLYSESETEEHLNGKRDLSTIEQIAKEGKSKLQTLQKKNYKILRKTISEFKENNDPLDILIENLSI